MNHASIETGKDSRIPYRRSQMEWIEILKPRVQRGAKLLDRLSPGWDRKVSIDDLAMDSCDRCILGHVYGGYVVGYEALRLQLPSAFLSSASDFGFTLRLREHDDLLVPTNEITARFGVLADLWRDEIRSRTEAA